MALKCPYCAGPLDEPLARLPAMRARRRRIYIAVLQAGPEGLETAALMKEMYEPGRIPTKGAYAMLRVNVHEMNKTLAALGQKITGKPYGRYRLVSITGESSGTTAEEPTTQADHRANPQNPNPEQ